MHQKLILSSLLLCLTSQARVQDARDAEIEKFLKRFDANPAQTMDEPLHKIIHESQKGRHDIKPIFTEEDIRNGDFVRKKDLFRKHMSVTRNGLTFRLEQARAGRAGIAENDQPLDLIDANEDSIILTLEEMEQKGLKKAHLPENPWSDSYWPIYQGQIAARYGDSDFMNASSDDEWQSFFDYIQSPEHSFGNIFSTLSGSSRRHYDLDLLSPAEKYDLLVGDADGTLTDAMWAAGKEYADSNNGVVERWMGLCHGWAAAAIMEERPTSAVEVVAADGKTHLKFYPADIKALTTTLWANGNVPSRFMGGRCNTEKPHKDANGRITDNDCFDTNPGSWHLAVVNQLGASQRSVVMDATYDYEVWNHPILSYKYSYFNPITDESSRSLENAVVPLAKYKKDPFAKYRSDEAVSIVGVAMDVEYMIETQPDQSETDSADSDLTASVRYIYDLELNANGEIIGGEWRSNKHPDFLWVNKPGQRATTSGDRYAKGEWDAGSKEAFPSDWTGTAVKMSGKGLPLEKVVHALIKASRQ